MVTQSESYPARLDIDYPEKLDRLTTFFRLIWVIPIAIMRDNDAVSRRPVRFWQPRLRLS